MPQLGAAMATGKAIAISFHFFLLLSTIFLGSLPVPGYGFTDGGSFLKSKKELQTKPTLPVFYTEVEQGLSSGGLRRWGNKNARRLMIGSTAPTCTYNECRGCRFKCSAQQVPVDANDPINSAYHYRCVCHRR